MNHCTQFYNSLVPSINDTVLLCVYICQDLFCCAVPSLNIVHLSKVSVYSIFTSLFSARLQKDNSRFGINVPVSRPYTCFDMHRVASTLVVLGTKFQIFKINVIHCCEGLLTTSHNHPQYTVRTQQELG